MSTDKLPDWIENPPGSAPDAHDAPCRLCGGSKVERIVVAGIVCAGTCLLCVDRNVTHVAETLPVIVAECRACQRGYTAAEWARLERTNPTGRTVAELDRIDRASGIQQRQCTPPCLGTMAVKV